MRRNAELRGKKSFPKLVDRTVILVDDGLASGFTMLVAVEALAKNGAQNILAAIPTGLLRSIETLSSRVEAIFCPNIRSGMVFAVADAYENWSDVSENEVTALLREAGHQGSRE
jgi:predicted phosphoribosyltransferase